MPDASPPKWHLAHSSWFFETVILQVHLAGYSVFNPDFAYLFNSYYNSFGDRHARPSRGLLSRPELSKVLAYREHVDKAMIKLLAQADSEVLRLVEIGLNHEQQHQELLLTDILHGFSCNPLLPTYDANFKIEAASSHNDVPLSAGQYAIGHADFDQNFAYDNEGPRHQQIIQDVRVSGRLVRNHEFLAFIEDGGYENSEHWLSDGWDWRQENKITHPLYWQQQGKQWLAFGLNGLQAIEPDRAACHLSYYEADAYARWAGARLPTEAEWEVAANQAENGDWHGQCWQWTMSPYMPYPGYQPPEGALGEYNAKFMCNQMVLRGSSCVTPQGHARNSYRNFFYPTARWQFSGLRLAFES